MTWRSAARRRTTGRTDGARAGTGGTGLTSACNQWGGKVLNLPAPGQPRGVRPTRRDRQCQCDFAGARVSRHTNDVAEAVAARPIAPAEQVAPCTERAGIDCWLLVVVLCSILLCLPYLRTFFALDDEGVLLYGADRMLQGKSLYGDFFEFLPPGGFVVTALWFSLAGVSVLSARALAILVIAGIAGFTYLTCRRASRNAPLSAVLTLGWVVMSQGLWTQVSHHWLTTLFSIMAAWAAFISIEQARRGLRWPLMAGVAAGMAAMITPTCGALAMLAAMAAFVGVKRHKRVDLSVFVLGGLVIPVCLIGYLLWRHVFAAAFDDVILFTARRYAPIQVLPFGDRANAQNYPLMTLFPIAAVLLFLVWARDWRTCLSDRLLWLAAALGLAGFIGSFPRADVAHIAFNVPLALPLFALCVCRLAANGGLGCVMSSPRAPLCFACHPSSHLRR